MNNKIDHRRLTTLATQEEVANDFKPQPLVVYVPPAPVSDKSYHQPIGVYVCECAFVCVCVCVCQCVWKLLPGSNRSRWSSQVMVKGHIKKDIGGARKYVVVDKKKGKSKSTKQSTNIRASVNVTSVSSIVKYNPLRTILIKRNIARISFEPALEFVVNAAILESHSCTLLSRGKRVLHFSLKC